MPLPANKQIAQNPHVPWGFSAYYSPKCIYTLRSNICLLLSDFMLGLLLLCGIMELFVGDHEKILKGNNFGDTVACESMFQLKY